jgi:hypothetical protein
MGGCYDRKSLVAETELINKMQKLRITSIDFSELSKKFIEKSEKAKSSSESPVYTITKENYLSVLSSYFKLEKELYVKVYESLADNEIKRNGYLSSHWAFYSVLSLSNNTYAEKINYFLRIMFINDLKEFSDPEVIISNKTTANIALINIFLTNYLSLNLLDYFNALTIALNNKDVEFVRSVEFLSTKVLIPTNIEAYITKIFESAHFSKNWDSELTLETIKSFLDSNKYLLLFFELRPHFIRDYE